jgi:copper(I)-binding protein
MTMKRTMLFALALLFAGLTQGADADPSVVVSDGWTRASLGGSTPIYATISNEGDTAVRLIGVMTPGAKAAELHDPAKGTAPVAAIAIPAHGSVTLAPNGPYIELTGLTDAVQPDGALLVRMHFEGVGWIVAIVKVRSI